MESLPRFFLFERYDRYNDPKKHKGDHNLSEKKIEGQAFPFECTCGSNTRLKLEIETCKIERSIALMPLVLTATCLMNRNRFLVISLDG